MLYEYRIQTRQREELIDITHQVKEAVTASKVKNGLAVVYTPHTTTAVSVNENADPDVKRDMVHFLNQKIPKNWGFHHMEGNSDSHIKSSLFGCSQTFIIDDGIVVLGVWQGILFCEFDGARNRKFFVKIMGDE